MSIGKERRREKHVVQRDICVAELFKNSYVDNTINFNTVVVSSGNDIAFISGLDFSISKNIFESTSDICVTSDEHLIKIHFSLEGAYSYQPLNHINYLVQIPENHCNLFFYPGKQGKDIFNVANTKAFEIYLKPSILRKTLGLEYKSVLAKLHEAISNSSSFVLWDKSKFIPPPIRSTINEIIQCSYKGGIKKIYLESKLKILLIDFLIGGHTSKKTKQKSRLVNSDYLALVKVEAHIRNNLKEPLKILDLAEIAGFNTTKLKRDFKKVYGMPVFKYITAQRMEVAKSLIIQDGLSIASASYEVGYANPQHFTTAFKRTMGYLPSELKA